MKMYTKSELNYIDGYIVYKNKIVGVDNDIVDLMNNIELNYQKAIYLKNQPKVTQADYELEKFVPRSEFNVEIIGCETPTLDKKIDETMKIMQELDDFEASNKANEWLKGNQQVVRFIKDNFVVSCDQMHQHRFDLPTLGNPLEWDLDTLEDIINTLFMVVE